jgi:hypothetical protein
MFAFTLASLLSLSLSLSVAPPKYATTYSFNGTFTITSAPTIIPLTVETNGALGQQRYVALSLSLNPTHAQQK